MVMTCILIDCSLLRTFKWRNKDIGLTAYISQYSIFEPSVFYGKHSTGNPRDFLVVKRVSVLTIFIATAYDILRFSTMSEIKKSTHIKHTDSLRHVFVYTCQMIHRDKSNRFSIVHRRRTSWPFPRRVPGESRDHAPSACSPQIIRSNKLNNLWSLQINKTCQWLKYTKQTNKLQIHILLNLFSEYVCPVRIINNPCLSSSLEFPPLSICVNILSL